MAANGNRRACLDVARPCTLFFLLCLVSGCATVPESSESGVLAGVASRMALGIGPAGCGPILPNGATLDDGLTEEEAVLIALWNNALFHQHLAELGIARGELVQAGLLPNPDFLYTFHVPDKPFRYAIELPLEAFWLRPIRVKAAQSEVGRVREQLTQVGIDLMRDVRQAYADVLLAQGQHKVTEEAVRVRGAISNFADARLKAGDINPQEAATARVDALQAQQDLKRAGYDVALAEERLRNLLAIGEDRRPLALDAGTPPAVATMNVETVIADAVASRPDALAAAQSTAAAAERLRLAKLSWVRLTGIGDATAGQRSGHEFGPGFRVAVPIFDRNQGNIARAEAELERTRRQQLTIHNQIILDVRQAHFQYEQARTELDILEGKVLPEAKQAIQRAERAYREGETPYVVVLEATRQILTSLSRREQLHANLRRAWAELERSAGRRLECAPPYATLGEPTP